MLRRTLFNNLLIIFSNLLVLLTLSSSLLAKPIDNLDDFLSQHNLQEVGKARFSVLFWDIYDSKLLTSSGSYKEKFPAEQTILFEINYLRDISKSDLIDKTIDQWQHINVSEDQYARYIPLLENIWPNIKAGDKLALLIQNQTSQFFYNNQLIGNVDVDNFHQHFINIWLSPNTSQPKLRKSLLGIE